MDNTRAVLPGVMVTVSGPAAMGTPTSTTNENGIYRVPSLPPGEYTVRFELTGFGTVIREGIRVGVGFTATVNTEMNLASVAESVTVSGDSPVVDVTNTTVATRYDDEVLASLPGARDYWAVLAQTPAVAMGRVDVGGSGALTQQPYTAYGLASAGGVNRAEVEGIMVNEGAGGGGSDMYYTDYGAFAEIAINAVGNGAEMPNPGVLSQLIAKSGGNQYHGNVYFDFQNESMEATNIDDAQIAAGVIGSDVVAAARHEPPRDVPRLQRRSRRLHQEGPPVVVWRLPPDRHRPALSHAARRHPGHVGPGRHGKATLNVGRRTTSSSGSTSTRPRNSPITWAPSGSPAAGRARR